ncbi:MAG: PD-(D/E)XK nuclease family transposase, partial [Treponema sp.]|nr:PD-(D/E)XK nuclease family transposase [Treponema sp.]
MEKKTRLRPTPTALLNPRCDASFKAMFTQETKESHAALQDFISTLLGRQVKEVQLVPNEPPVDMIGEMQMSFDVSVIFGDDERADLEMQARQQEYDYAVRAETQAARLLNLSARKGKNWKVAKVYQISVLDFHFDKDDKSALEWYTMRKASGGKLGERLNVIFFDLLKIK